MPVDIERAMRNDYSDEPRQRNLQLEARAHVTVQEWIDKGGLASRGATTEGICEIHKRFGDLLPEELLWVEDPESGERVCLEPGALRKRDVKVGGHVAISPGGLPRFLDRFEGVYSKLGKAETIFSAAAFVGQTSTPDGKRPSKGKHQKGVNTTSDSDLRRSRSRSGGSNWQSRCRRMLRRATL